MKCLHVHAAIISTSRRVPLAKMLGQKYSGHKRRSPVLQAPARAATRASKQAEKGKAVASGPTTPSPKGKAAAKRAAEPVNQAEESPKKAAKHSSEEAPTPAKPPPTPSDSVKQAPGGHTALTLHDSSQHRAKSWGLICTCVAFPDTRQLTTG